jgi:hypothetical protein
MFMLTLFAGFTTSCVQAQQRLESDRTLWIDENPDYAKASCRWDPTLQGCKFGLDAVTAEVRDFGNRLTTEFAANSQCKGIRVFPRRIPLPGYKGWYLFLEFEPGARRQRWFLIHDGDDNQTLTNQGDPAEIARYVCSIIMGQGAKVN